MPSASLESGTCPVCAGRDVYTSRGTSISARTERQALGVSFWRPVAVDSFVCLGCGLIEDHIAASDMARSAETIRAQWAKVTPT